MVGATEISGFNTIRSLLDTPQRWTTIYALYRRLFTDEMLSLLTPEQQSRIQHVSVDLTSSTEAIASAMKTGNVSADYVFFLAYIHSIESSAMDPKAKEELAKTNVPISRKFLKALPLAHTSPKRNPASNGR